MCRLDEPRYPPVVAMVVGAMVGLAWLLTAAAFVVYVVAPAWRRLVG